MLMRSKLFVPGSRPELFEKAAASTADALSFDLEDAVAESRKAEARDAVAAYLARSDRPRKLLIVRVNGLDTPHFTADLDALVGAGPDLVNLPMVDEVDAVREAAARLEAVEAAMPSANHAGLLINIETPRSLRRAAELASAHPRVAGLQIGYGDLLEPLGIDRRDSDALAHIRLAVRFAAAEAGIPAYDGAFAAIDDPDGYRAECLAARRHGLAGKSCIHPSQIATANEAFKPTEAEIAKARRIVEAAEAAEAKGIGAYLVDGKMVDAPFVARARAVLALADRTGAET